MGLRETLEAATPGPWRGEVDSVLWSDEFMVGGFEKYDDAVLAALAPELGALVLDMGEYLRLHAYRMPEFSWEEEATCRVCASPASKGHNEVCPLGALLARLDQLGKEPA